MASERTTKGIAYVARVKGSCRYAYEGQETGMGRVIESGSLSQAKRCHSPAALMAWLGGHYTGYEAVKLVVTYAVGGVAEWPPEDSVFYR